MPETVEISRLIFLLLILDCSLPFYANVAETTFAKTVFISIPQDNILLIDEQSPDHPLTIFHTPLHNAFVFKLIQYFQHMLSNLFRIIIQPITNNAKTVWCQNPTMYYITLILLKLFIFNYYIKTGK